MKMKTFQWVPFPDHLYKKAERIDGGPFRLYRTREGNMYPSVTSILGSRPKPELEEWKARVGEEEARRVGLQATERGSRFHSIAEDYLHNSLVVERHSPFDLQSFLSVKRILDERVDGVLATEIPMYSDRIRAAGTIDLLAHFDGKMSLLDFKTSKRHKYKDEIEDYFLQTTAYCMMVGEMLDIWIKKIVILMMVDGGDCLVFEEDSSNYVKSFLKVRKEFEKVYSL